MVRAGIGVLLLVVGVSGAAWAQKQPTPDTKKLNKLPFPKREEPNEAHERLMKMDEKDRAATFTALLKVSGEKCGKVTRTFFQGTASNGRRLGTSAVVTADPVGRIAADQRGSFVLSVSTQGVSCGDCFLKPSNSKNGSPERATPEAEIFRCSSAAIVKRFLTFTPISQQGKQVLACRKDVKTAVFI
jgi:hypothetical protein